jgi:hypothetical protein
MKNIMFGLLISLLTISCVKNEKNIQDGYCKKFDTIYKDNSTDIKSVTRTFYKKGEMIEDYFGLSQEIGKEDYAITLIDDNNISSILLDTESLKLFIDNAKTIIKNKGKDLRFDLGNLKNSNMTHSVGLEDGINIYSENLLGKSVSFELSNEDLINLEKAFEKYKNEK